MSTAEIKVCPGCDAKIRYFSIDDDHVKGCAVLAEPQEPMRDRDSALTLSAYFGAMAEQWPEAAETSRLLKLVK